MSEAATHTEETQDPILSQSSALVHLHDHSEMSSLDGGAKIQDMPAKCDELGMNAMGLTDHGVMQGLPEFYDAMKKAGKKPILGCEIYLTNNRFDRSGLRATPGTPTWHLTLLAETTEGYRNLCKLTSWAFIDGVISTFGRPRARADWELMERYSEGIICLTGCMAAPLMNALFEHGSITQARAHTERLRSIFGEKNVYGEIQNVGIVAGIPANSEVARWLADHDRITAEQAEKGLSEEEAAHYDGIDAGEVPLSQTDANRIAIEEIFKPLGMKYAVTGDVHYLNKDDADWHDSMICIGTAQLKKGNRRFSLLPKLYYMRSEDEVRSAVADWPESIDTTREIALRCNAEIEYGRELLPKFPIPEGFEGSSDYLRQLCFQGLEERYPEGHPLRKQAIDRLEMELGVIGSMGFNDYFLIVWDLFAEATRRKILSGPGRGSAAGAIVAYCLDITKICPLENKLLFERFLNPDRVSMPDIDMDFPQKHLEEMKAYAREKYNGLAGCDTAVAQIVTFGKFKAKGALRDACRVLAWPPSEEGKAQALQLGDKLSRLIPDDPKATMRSVWQDKQLGEPLRKAYRQGGLAGEAITLAGKLEGFVRTNGIHAAAVLIASHDLTDDLPLQRFGDDKPLHTQYDMVYSEKLGLLKMDFLGLRNLDIIDDTCKKIEAVHGVSIHPYRDIPLDDAKTYELFARGESIGTFQFECLAGDTIIGGGPRKTIADLYQTPPSKLWSLDLDSGGRHRNDVLAVVQSGEKQLYRLVADGGYTLRATADHKILTSAGWKRLGAIEPGDRIVVNPRDASRIGACMNCHGQTRSRSGACTSCRNRERDSGGVMSANRDHERWSASLPRGANHPHFGSPPPPAAFRVPGLAHPVRSEWEGKLALRLRELDEPYEYEPKSFLLSDGSSYTPDFYLPERDLWIEAKGRSGLCGAKGRKFHAFQHEYPHVRIVAVGSRKIPTFRADALSPIAGSSPEWPVTPQSFTSVTVKAVEKDAVEMTYDIAMRSPFNNYMANGIVVHNSGGMQGALKEVRPTDFNDLVALVALYRPGPMQNIPVYAARKYEREPVTLLDDRLSEVLEDTYGIVVYQEQSMLVARTLAGFTPGQADDLRKAIGKKIREKMMALKDPFVKGCVANGVDRKVALELWDDNERAADYSFNRSHAACYAYLAYITGWLKVNYPNEYWASLLTSVIGQKKNDKPRLYLTEGKRMGLSITPPDINRSLNDFAVLEREEEPGKYDILFGLTALTGVGSGVVGEIRAERERGGPFTTLFDLIRRMPHLNKTVIHSLIKGGALDSTGASRKSMHDETEESIKRIRKEHSDREREFCKAIMTAVEEALPAESDEWLLAPPKGKNPKGKLTTTAKRGIEGAAKLVWSQRDRELPAEEEIQTAINDALIKELLRVARAEARKSHKENEAEVAGIAAEEQSGSSAKDQIEQIAQEQVDAHREETLARAKQLLAPVIAAASAELEARAESEHLEAAMAAETDPTLPAEEWSDVERLRLERKTLGTYVTGHPLEKDARQWARYVSKGLGQINEEQIGQRLRVVGAITGIEERTMKNGDLLRNVSLEDLTGSKTITIFPRTLEGGLEQLLEEDAVVCLEIGVFEDTFTRSKQDTADAGESDEHDDEQAEKPIKLTASRIYRWDPTRVTGESDAPLKPVRVQVQSRHFNREWVGRLEAICEEFPGEHPVALVLDGQEHKTKLRVNPTSELVAAVKRLLMETEPESEPAQV